MMTYPGVVVDHGTYRGARNDADGLCVELCDHKHRRIELARRCADRLGAYRIEAYGRVHRFVSFEAARDVASRFFARTGIVLGIEGGPVR